MIKLGLIGYPIQHSLSPWIHEQFLEKSKLTGEYRIYEINTSDNFKVEVDKLKSSGITGFNITVPYKETIIDQLDELDESVKKIGAVNTVLNDNGNWIGYNTDGLGYVKSLTTKFPQLANDKNKRVLIIGAGGAARGIYYAFLQERFSQVDIANRTTKKAEHIITMNEGHILSDVLTLDEAESDLNKYDIIVQTTSVGMKPNINDSILTLKNINKDAIVSDIVYQPIKTKLLQKAEKHGCQIHFGHTMLLYQAQLAFNIWTNHDVEVGDMDVQLQKILEG